MIGQLLLNTVLFFAGAAWLAGILSLWTGQGSSIRRGRSEAWWFAARVLTWLLAIFLAGAVLYLALLLLVGDFSVLYVWKHSATYQTPGQRLTALLAGQEGSFLLWSFFTAIAGLWTVEWRYRLRPSDQVGSQVIHLVLLAIIFFLLLITQKSTPFQSFHDAFPSLALEGTPLEGNGLNPVLLNPWMPVHTFFTFAGYALVSLAFAVAWLQLVQAARRRFVEGERWQRAYMAVARWAWLLLSIALLTGIIWAYEEMTFGWIWSWDPVEASALAVWLVLTAALHAARIRPTPGRTTLLAPFLTALTMVVVIFASFITRSGLHPSVHAFAGGVTGHYLGGFLLIIIVAVGVPYLLAWRRADARLAHRSPPGAAGRTATGWVTGVLLGAAGLIVWGVSYPIMAGQWQQPVDLDTTFFNLWGYLLALILLFLMGWELQPRMMARRERIQMLALFLVLAAIAALVRPVAGLELVAAERRLGIGPLYAIWGQISVLSLFPAVVYAFSGLWGRWWSSGVNSTRRRQMHESGLAAIHAGAIVALVGVTLSSLFVSTVTVTVNPLTNQAGVKDGIGVRVVDFARSEQIDARGLVIAQQETVSLEVFVGDVAVAAGQAHLTTYPERAMGRHPHVLIDRGLLFDTQVIYRGMAEADQAGVPITVRRIPLMSLVWAGLFLFIPGFGLLMGSRLLPQSVQRDPIGYLRPENEAVGAVTGKGSLTL